MESLTITKIESGQFGLTPMTRTIVIDKKLLEALLYSHFASACWFEWTEIEDVELEGDKIKIIYKKENKK